MKQAAPELLSPAGDSACLTAAIENGCNAVYFGVSCLNMRSGGARNFEIEDIPDVIAQCHEADVKAYLTVNTVVLDAEQASLANLLETAAPLVDAVICWDLSVIDACRERDIPFHISTQASVANAAAARLYRQLGAERIILARECTLDDIIDINKQTAVPLEVFIHGAMCVSVSGRCFMSQEVFGRSANRGECLQNCRRKFIIRDCEEDHEFEIGEDYVLSARDLCTMPFIEQVLDTGVASLKIEGRGRNPEYVATVTRCYRQAIDAWREERLTDELKESLTAQLRSVFNREFSPGFYLGRPIADFTHSYGSQATTRKEFVGIIENCYRKAGVVAIQVQSSTFTVGDQLYIQGPTTGSVELTVTEIRKEDSIVQRAPRALVTIPIKEKVRANDKVFVIVESE